MSATIAIAAPARSPSASRGHQESRLVRWTLIGLALGFLTLFPFVPLVAVVHEALKKGLGVYWHAITHPDALSAIHLTLLKAAIAVPPQPGGWRRSGVGDREVRVSRKKHAHALIDLPVSVSPVIAGLVFVLVFGAQGWFGPWLQEHDIKIILAVPGIVLATAFVTSPFIARELIPLMEEVYEHPATPFVYRSLGSVNLFHGRVHEGRTEIGDHVLEAPEHADVGNTPAEACARAHEIEVLRDPEAGAAIRAILQRAVAVGQRIRLELSLEEGDRAIEAEVGRDAWRSLGVGPGDRVFLRPQRFRVLPTPATP